MATGCEVIIPPPVVPLVVAPTRAPVTPHQPHHCPNSSHTNPRPTNKIRGRPRRRTDKVAVIFPIGEDLVRGVGNLRLCLFVVFGLHLRIAVPILRLLEGFNPVIEAGMRKITITDHRHRLRSDNLNINPKCRYVQCSFFILF